MMAMIRAVFVSTVRRRRGRPALTRGPPLPGRGVPRRLDIEMIRMIQPQDPTCCMIQFDLSGMVGGLFICAVLAGNAVASNVGGLQHVSGDIQPGLGFGAVGGG